MPADWRAAAASVTLGISIVDPRTTGEFSESPFAAARALVVKLLAAAIDHSVSPGWTTCGTPAEAGAAASKAVASASPSARPMFAMTRRFPGGSEGDSRYGRMQKTLQNGCSRRVRAMDTLY